MSMNNFAGGCLNDFCTTFLSLASLLPCVLFVSIVSIRFSLCSFTLSLPRLHSKAHQTTLLSMQLITAEIPHALAALQLLADFETE